MQHSWPQGFAVSIMRRVRPNLESEHARILRQPPDKLFDMEAIWAKARPGDIGVDNTDPVFLTLASKDDATTRPRPAVCRGIEKVHSFRRDEGASSMTIFEVATLAHRLRAELMTTEPRRRGRG